MALPSTLTFGAEGSCAQPLGIDGDDREYARQGASVQNHNPIDESRSKTTALKIVRVWRMVTWPPAWAIFVILGN